MKKRLPPVGGVLKKTAKDLRASPVGELSQSLACKIRMSEFFRSSVVFTPRNTHHRAGCQGLLHELLDNRKISSSEQPTNKRPLAAPTVVHILEQYVPLKAMARVHLRSHCVVKGQ